MSEGPSTPSKRCTVEGCGLFHGDRTHEEWETRHDAPRATSRPTSYELEVLGWRVIHGDGMTLAEREAAGKIILEAAADARGETPRSETAPKTRLLSINNIERFHAGDEKLEPDPDGPWVRFEDAAAISNRLASAASTTLPKIDPEALRLAYEFDDDPDKRAQVKVMIAHHIGPQTADLIDEAVKVSRELIRIAEGK